MNDELSPDAKNLLELATSDDSLSPGAEDRARIQKRIGIAVAAGSAVGLSSAAAKASAAAGSAGAAAGSAGAAGIAMGGLGLKGLAALALVGGVVGVGALSIPQEQAPPEHASTPARSAIGAPVEPATAPAVPPRGDESIAPAPSLPSLEPPPVRETQTPRVQERRTVIHEAVDEAVDEPTNEGSVDAPDETAIRDESEDEIDETLGVSIGDELALLRAAQRARVSGNTAEALRQLAAHEARFPDGRLAAERDGTRVFVLCDAHRSEEADVARAAFLRLHPRSPLARRVEIECR